MTDLNELLLESERLEALQECRNLMGRYSLLHAAFRNREYVELWAKREDDWIRMPFGQFNGWEGVRHCYVDIHGDRNDPDDREELKGLMMVHLMDTEVIEVAADGRTAKGCWLSPGVETGPAPGKEKGAWCWGKYEVEFIKEDGVWKFWHLTLYPVFLTPYNHSWGEKKAVENMQGTVIFDDPLAAKDPAHACQPLPKPMWEYGPEAEYPVNEPAIPEPYASYPGI